SVDSVIAASCSRVAADVHVTMTEPGVKSGALFRRSGIDNTTSAAARTEFVGFSTAILTDLTPSRHRAEVVQHSKNRRQLNIFMLISPCNRSSCDCHLDNHPPSTTSTCPWI